MTDPQPPALRRTPTEPDHYRPEASIDLVVAARDFADGARWVWAKTFAAFAPHHYTLRRDATRAGTAAGYDALRHLIREHHYPRAWRGRTFRSVTLNGLLLWIMPDENGPDGGSILVNAKPAERDDWQQPTLFDHL